MGAFGYYQKMFGKAQSAQKRQVSREGKISRHHMCDYVLCITRLSKERMRGFDISSD